MGTPSKTTEKEEEIKEEYLNTLQGLVGNSKPLIDVLTEVAEENKEYASTIASCIEEHLQRVSGPLKLPILYLIDSIIKNANINQYYIHLFCQNLDKLFAKVHEQGDENMRGRLLKLRLTWNGILPAKCLASLDNMVRVVNANWPSVPLIHVNPKFVINTQVPTTNGTVVAATTITPGSARTPQNPPTFRIAPVSSQLINAAKRVRDPRLRKIELQQIRPSGGSSVAATKSASAIMKTPASSATKVTAVSPKQSITSQSLESAKIAKKNDNRPQLPPQTSAESAPTGSVMKVSKPRVDTPKMKKKEELKISDLFDEWAVNQRGEENKGTKAMGKVWTKEDREKGMKALAKALEQDKEERIRVLNSLKKSHPKVAQRLEKLMSPDESSDNSMETVVAKKPVIKASPTKKVPAKTVIKVTVTNNVKKDANSTKKVPVAYKKPASPTTLKVQPVTPSIVVPTTNAVQLPESVAPVAVPVTIAAPVTSAIIPAVTVPVPPAPIISASALAATLVATPSTTVMSTTVEPTVITCEKMETEEVAPAYSPKSSDAAIDSTEPVVSNPFGILEITKTKDIDYRQIFRFPIIPVGSIVPEISEQTPKMESDENAVLVESPKRTKKRRRTDTFQIKRKRRRTVSTSDSSSDESHERRKPKQTHVTCEDERSRSSLDLDTKPVKINDMCYSETVQAEEETKPSNLVMMPVLETPDIPKPPPIFPKFDTNFGAKLPSDGAQIAIDSTPEIPATDLSIVEMIRNDPVKHINIDGVSREIRHYGYQGVVFMKWDDPREITFYPGVRNVIVDDKFGIPCTLNMPEVETLVYGSKHRIRLGVPTRELFVDGIGYECFFGGPSILIKLNEVFRNVKLDGPAPSVNISPVKKLDLVAGKISLIIDDQHKFPLFLDAKPQIFEVDGKPLVVMLIDCLKRILINNVPFRTDFGGVSQSFKFMGKIYDFRLTVLPKGIVAGAVNISQMVMTRIPSPPPLPPSLQYPALKTENTSTSMVPAPPVPPASLVNPMMSSLIPPVSILPTVPTIPGVSVVPLLSQPTVTNPMTATLPAVESEVPAPSTSKAAPAATTTAPGILDTISIDELFQKLVASGIVPNAATESKNEEEDSNTVKYVDFNKPDSFKQRQPALIKTLYSGIQCGSCGVRFPAEQTLKYSQHLDWHFRLNRKGKDGARTIHSRKWFYGTNDWIMFQEMEEPSDRGSSYFDTHPVMEYTEEILEDMPCVPAGSKPTVACELCRDTFEQFYNEESDEWQLRNAIKVEENIYHPTCYQDHKEKEEKLKTEIEENAAAQQQSEEEKLNSEAVIIMEEDEEEPPKSPLKPTVEPKEQPEEKIDTEDEDSDIEEVQLIEQPIEEIVIQDDGNDFDEPNLETLNTEEIIAVQQEIEERPPTPPLKPEEIPIKIEDDPEKIFEISDAPAEPTVVEDNAEELVRDSPEHTMGAIGVMSIDGNIELMDSGRVLQGPVTKIKLNITKNHVEDRVHSPRNDESQVSSTNDQEALVAASIKSRVKDAKLTVYPAVNRGVENSGLCSIM